MREMMVLSVSQVNTYIKSLMDGDRLLTNIYLRGEISNFKNHIASGHYYFSLKDEGGAIQAAMFRRANMRLKFMPENGMSVIVRGRISLYEKTGTYSIYVEEMQPDGTGALYFAYEQLKARLEKEGLFSDEFKKPLPEYPSKVAVITSETGAAVRDIMNVLSRRYPLASVVLLPVLVQGDGAARQITQAVKRCNDEQLADVMIVGRGGGSIEDLWAFNDEELARTVFASQIPVISAVGHETDFTIIDFVADMRAPTPSAAAELAVPDINAVENRLTMMKAAGKNALLRILSEKRSRLDLITDKPCMKSPMFIVREKQMYVDLLTQRMLDSYKKFLALQSGSFSVQQAKLEGLNPLSVLNRGYAVVYKDGKIISSTADVKIGDVLKIRLSDGTVCSVVKQEEESQ